MVTALKQLWKEIKLYYLVVKEVRRLQRQYDGEGKDYAVSANVNLPLLGKHKIKSDPF